MVKRKDKWDHTGYSTHQQGTRQRKKRIKALYETADISIINRENVVWLVDYKE